MLLIIIFANTVNLMLRQLQAKYGNGKDKPIENVLVEQGKTGKWLA